MLETENNVGLIGIVNPRFRTLALEFGQKSPPPIIRTKYLTSMKVRINGYAPKTKVKST